MIPVLIVPQILMSTKQKCHRYFLLSHFFLFSKIIPIIWSMNNPGCKYRLVSACIQWPCSMHWLIGIYTPESDLCFDACVKTNKELLLTKVTKCCAQSENKRRIATFAFTGTAAINAKHLEHRQKKEGESIGSKNNFISKGKGTSDT